MTGQPHGGPLSRDLLDELVDIRSRGESGSVHNQFKLAEFVITSSRERSRILEPHERPNVYMQFTKLTDPMEKELADLYETRDPGLLATQLRKHFSLESKRETSDRRFRVLREGLALAPRVGESFGVELLQRVPSMLAEVPTESLWRLARNVLRPGPVIQCARPGRVLQPPRDRNDAG